MRIETDLSLPLFRPPKSDFEGCSPANSRLSPLGLWEGKRLQNFIRLALYTSLSTYPPPNYTSRRPQRVRSRFAPFSPFSSMSAASTPVPRPEGNYTPIPPSPADLQVREHQLNRVISSLGTSLSLESATCLRNLVAFKADPPSVE